MVAALPIVLLAASVATPSGADTMTNETVLESFDRDVLPSSIRLNNVTASLVSKGRGKALHVEFARVDWPNVFFQSGKEAWDWSGYAGIAVDVFNPEQEPVTVCMRVDNEGADGINHCITQTISAPPQQWTTLATRFQRDPGMFWGMRGVPVWGPLPGGKEIDLTRIVAFQIFLPRPSRSFELLLDHVRLFGHSTPLEELVSLPFVDRFGQYRHADWPGKIHSDKDLLRRKQQEEKALVRQKPPKDRDALGGWRLGPRLEATGWFRTARVNDKWWLVTPEGRLFFSVGMDCVGTWERTFVERRDGWFEWLPDREQDSFYKDLFTYVHEAHSMADPVGGEGWTFSFYGANLIRKYGDDWRIQWRETAYRRLRSWGFNTIGSWAQEDVLENSPMPFTVAIGIHGEVKRISAGSGYWSRMYDVYDPTFADRVEACVGAVARKYADNPMCIGFFVDNELGWEDIRRGTLPSPSDQPCRQALVRRLKEKYGEIGIVAKTWNVTATDWDSLRLPETPSEACKADMDAYVYEFARRYFDVVNDALKRHAPHHLYFGCRFAGRPDRAVLQACADVADVMSFNLYYPAIDSRDWSGPNDCGKPILIGEFHFGALDRGMFHPGLGPTRNQKERAAAYARYVNSVADCPAFVGCHWFQYIDEPITGRWFDGENYNVGFVTVTDTPYPELVRAARVAHQEMYRRRGGGALPASCPVK